VFAFKLCLFKHLRSKMTPRRQLVLDFIKAYIRIHGIAPSYEVIAKGLKMKSKANIHRIVHRLQDDGYVSIKPHKFHSIKLVDRSVKEISAL
jgi:repressor LexA